MDSKKGNKLWLEVAALTIVGQHRHAVRVMVNSSGLRSLVGALLAVATSSRGSCWRQLMTLRQLADREMIDERIWIA